MQGKALLNLCQRCVRANHLAGSFMVTKTVAIAFHPCAAKFSMLEEIPCQDVHLARCLQFAMHKFRLSLFVKDLEPGGSTTFCFSIV